MKLKGDEMINDDTNIHVESFDFGNVDIVGDYDPDNCPINAISE